MNKIQAAEARGYQKAIDALRKEGAAAEERFREAGNDGSNWDAYDAAADYLEWLRDDAVPRAHRP